LSEEKIENRGFFHETTKKELNIDWGQVILALIQAGVSLAPLFIGMESKGLEGLPPETRETLNQFRAQVKGLFGGSIDEGIQKYQEYRVAGYKEYMEYLAKTDKNETPVFGNAFAAELYYRDLLQPSDADKAEITKGAADLAVRDVMDGAKITAGGQPVFEIKIEE